VSSIEPIVLKLRESQRQLLSAADAVAREHWQTSPGEGRWCAAQLVAHLMLVERGVLGIADRISQKEPKSWPFYRRFHVPLKVVESRFLRRKSPPAVAPAEVAGKEDMLAELREVRERTLAFLDETKTRDLSAHRWPHPFLGLLSLYDWLAFIASHEIRHTKQMREIAASLPKSVESLHR
jgi:uncharacterized damage-inducible protein DinB